MTVTLTVEPLNRQTLHITEILQFVLDAILFICIDQESVSSINTTDNLALFSAYGKSLTKIKQINSLSQIPWGTPHYGVAISEMLPSNTTHCHLLTKVFINLIAIC